MKKKCPKCSSEHEKPGKFCSQSCANSRVWTPEIEAKRSQSLKEFWSGEGQQLIDEYRKTGSERFKAAWVMRKERLKLRKIHMLENEPFENLSRGWRKELVLKEQDNKCHKCGLSEWMGEPIVFELDHINGKSDDNRRENVRALCPNCHSQTPTWRGRNIRHQKNH